MSLSQEAVGTLQAWAGRTGDHQYSARSLPCVPQMPSQLHQHNKAPPYHWQIGMMQCCFVISENTTVDLAFFRHQTSSSQHKNTASFGRALWKMHVCANNCKPKTQRLVTCSGAWRARENNSVQRQTRADRPSLKLTSWCAARHLLRAFSPSVALAGVWLLKWDYEHIYCNGLACSPISL